MLLTVMFVLFSIFIIFWLVGFFVANDVTLPTGDISAFKNVLVVYPHPDDETLASGGILRKFAHQGSTVTVVVLTKGEKGTPDAHTEGNLKEIRNKEVLHATSILGVTKLILEDFGDGQLKNKKPILTKYLDSTLKRVKPDLVITYDLSGLYGHEDHISVSEILTRLIKKKYPTITLWYTSLPQKMIRMIRLPVHMAKNSEFQKRRTTPTMKVFIGIDVLYRIRAIYAYQSQIYSFQKSMPMPQIPVWWHYSIQIFEYYAKAN